MTGVMVICIFYREHKILVAVVLTLIVTIKSLNGPIASELTSAKQFFLSMMIARDSRC